MAKQWHIPKLKCQSKEAKNILQMSADIPCRFLFCTLHLVNFMALTGSASPFHTDISKTQERNSNSARYHCDWGGTNMWKTGQSLHSLHLWWMKMTSYFYLPEKGTILTFFIMYLLGKFKHFLAHQAEKESHTSTCINIKSMAISFPSDSSSKIFVAKNPQRRDLAKGTSLIQCWTGDDQPHKVKS